MIQVNNDDKLFFFEKSYFTLDGLWMIETEKTIGWEAALKVDTIVWVSLLNIIFRRLKRYLNLKENNLGELIEILTFRWSVEGWEYKILKNEKNEVLIEIKKCPYISIIERNPERREKIPLICKDVCIPLYDAIINNFNPQIIVKRTKYKGLGNQVCDFKLTQEGIGLKKFDIFSKKNSKTKINNNDKLFYFEKNFRTLDGFWMVFLEKETNFETALKVDTIVWQRLYKIIFHRIKRYLKVKGNKIKDLIEIITFVWSCEGYNYEIVILEENEALLNITTCPYKEAMDRNPERHNKIKFICTDMCVRLYEPVLEEFNPNIILKRTKYLGTGDKFCNFHFFNSEKPKI